MNLLKLDKVRYSKQDDRMPAFQKWFRRGQCCRIPGFRLLFRAMFAVTRRMRLVELSMNTQIGPGCYFGHAASITINPHAIIGSNVNIHKGVTIGQENRGPRKGAPTIGNDVWIGVGAVIVGNVRIGNDVLIAPNSFVNCDVPDHSVVLGNPCIIHSKDNATQGYVGNRVNVD